MKRRWKEKNFVCLFLFFILTALHAETGDLDAVIQETINAQRIKYGIPGLQVSVSLKNEGLPRDYVSGTTVFGGSIPVTRDHLFQIGSETKSFTSALLLKLASENILSLNDTLGRWLGNKIPFSWREITLKQLLNHTSGIYEFLETPQFNRISQQTQWKKQWTSQELVNLTIPYPLYFQPGRGWHYSNTNYILASMVIESATLKSFTSLITERLITPLGLSNTFYLAQPYTSEIMDHMVHGYGFQNTPPYWRDVTSQNMSMAAAAGAIISNSHDIADWLRQLLNSDSVLLPEQRAELMSLVDTKTGQPVSSSASGYGLGIRHDFNTFGEEAWWHNGSTNGYVSLMVWLKKRDIVVTVLLDMNQNAQIELYVMRAVISKLQSLD